MSAQASMLAIGNDRVLNIVKLGMNCDSAGCGKKTRPGFMKADGNSQASGTLPTADRNKDRSTFGR